jgi:small-conductance mechanosensitive channel
MNRLHCLARIVIAPRLPLLLWIGLLPATTWGQINTNPPVGAPAPTGYPLKVLNREVMMLRGNLGTYTPEQRAAAAGVRIERALQKSGGPRVDSQVVDGNAELRVHGQTVFFILPADVNELAGETLPSVLEQTVRQLDRAVAELEEFQDHESLLKSVALGLAATALLIGFVWLLARNRRWVETRLIRSTANKTDQIKSHSLRIFGLQNLVGVLRGLMTTVFWTATSVATFLWLELLLQLFPHTRPFGEQLQERFFHALAKLGQGALHALPNLGIVFVVLALARFAHTATRRFFIAVSRGNTKSRFFDQTTAPIAQRLFIILIWIFAIIVAFPYIPGSQTPAFRGISVLAGLMISLGAGNSIAQLVGGLTMVYNRTCRPGDFVRVGEHEGTIASVGFFSSRLLTGRNEEIVLPNSQISGGALINYSRLNESVGVLVPTTVTIGYNTPWRQVHALLQEAARRTPGLKAQPAPTVLQRQLSDFFVEYELRVALEKPAQRVSVLSQLHANIQDVFHESGVQIMSPHYEADPPQPVLVPREKWHEPPAPRPA